MPPAFVLLSCQAPADTAGVVPVAPARVVFISDTHIIGPQYTTPSENGDADNASILRTVERLAGVRDIINTIDPPVDRVFVSGDVLHDAYHSADPAWYEANESAWSVAAELFAGFEMPVHIGWGNHDYDVGCDGDGYGHELAHTLMERFFSTPPYHAVDLGGWRVILGNSQLGPTWTAGDPACETGTGSYGEAQLAWIDAQLAEGLPSIFLAHHMLLVTARDENTGPHPSLQAVLERHDNLRAAMVGHTHRWIDMTGSYPFPHEVVAATRYDADNLRLGELHPDGTLVWLDKEKAKWFTTCADTWSYQGTPKAVLEAVEAGDCTY